MPIKLPLSPPIPGQRKQNNKNIVPKSLRATLEAHRAANKLKYPTPNVSTQDERIPGQNAETTWIPGGVLVEDENSDQSGHSKGSWDSESLLVSAEDDLMTAFLKARQEKARASKMKPSEIDPHQVLRPQGRWALDRTDHQGSELQPSIHTASPTSTELIIPRVPPEYQNVRPWKPTLLKHPDTYNSSGHDRYAFFVKYHFIAAECLIV